ncbi:hypothetical protein GYMLUDRAFT_417830 [Collybiopsis luxurians FD-317 M1]|uniref:Uncharacterized protein n=1 Tax=Collybiopsis luxurians FD-317 M1 TaxID=944289 RepID=A0A0D0B9G2_9AGAR|nr:hypothetical protein GYMLUDRAFT_417830 [Collybiopsis luxurians FD-317 M1]
MDLEVSGLSRSAYNNDQRESKIELVVRGVCLLLTVVTLNEHSSKTYLPGTSDASHLQPGLAAAHPTRPRLRLDTDDTEESSTFFFVG